MEKNKIGTIFMISVLALAGIGITYAGFTDVITVFGTVNTATVELKVEDYSGTDVWKVYGPNAPPGEIVEWHGFISDPDRPTQTSLENQYPGCTVLPVSSAWAFEGTCFDVEMDYDNLFPCIDFTADVIIHYTGSIPVKVSTGAFVWDENGFNFGQYTTVKYYWYTNDDDEWIKGEEITTLPVQMHYCQYIGIEVTIHLAQDNELQGKSGSFGFDIDAIQWNDQCEQGPFPPEIIITEGSPDWTKAAGVRYKGYNTGKEIFLGPMTSPSATPRVEAEYNEFQTVGSKTYLITFAFDNVENKITTSITSPDANLAFDFDTDGAPGSDPSTWDAMEIVVRDSRTDSGVALENVMLETYSLGNFGTVDKAGTPGWQTWTVTGFDFSQSFTVTANLVVDGYNGNEAIKIEFNVGTLT